MGQLLYGGRPSRITWTSEMDHLKKLTVHSLEEGDILADRDRLHAQRQTLSRIGNVEV